MGVKKQTVQRIRNNSDLQLGMAQLIELDPAFRSVVDHVPEVPLRLRAPGFKGMAEIITAQQVSKASASAIFGRTLEQIQPFDAKTFLAAGTQPLIEAGQSRAKQVTLIGLAEAIVSGGLDLAGLCDVPVEQAMAELVALKGIGPWTAEVFLLFCAGHVDIFPAGDVALQHAVGDFCQLGQKPDAAETRKRAEKWQPLRGVAARVFYAHYATMRGKSAI